LIKKDKIKETEKREMSQEENVAVGFSCHVYNGEGVLIWSNLTVAECLGEAHGDFLNSFLSEIEFDVSEVV